jgi:hypothetical protein
MILSLHRYFCFFLIKGTESESFEVAAKFLDDTLSYYSKLSRNQNGYINTGYDPGSLDIQIPAQRWLKSIINKMKEDYGEKFDAEPEEVDKHREIKEQQFPAFFWEFESIEKKDGILEPTIQILTSNDVIVFRLSVNVEGYAGNLDTLKELLLNLEGNVWNYKTGKALAPYTVQFFQISSDRENLRFLESLNFQPVKFGGSNKKYNIKWGMIREKKHIESDYADSIVCEYPGNDLIVDDPKEKMKFQRETADFLNRFIGLYISEEKIENEATQVSSEDFKEVESTIEKEFTWIKNKLEEQTRSFAGSLSQNDFYIAQKKRVAAGKKLSFLNDFFNTAFVNYNHYRRESEKYFYSDDVIIAGHIRRLGTRIDNLHTSHMRLSNKTRIIQDELDLLLLLGTREISINHASDLITLDQKKNDSQNFCPIMENGKENDTQKFTVFRPKDIKNAKFDSLTKHYREALYSLPGDKLKAFLEEILYPNRELELLFSNPLKEGDKVLERIEIGKLPHKCKEDFDAAKFLKEINCDRLYKTEKCNFEGISEIRDETENTDDRSQIWISLNSMISFFEALCKLFDTPKHHINALEEFQAKKKHILFITGMLCLKANHCEKAKKFFSEAILLAHKENKFPWAFSIAQIASLCESCPHSANKKEEEGEKGDKGGRTEVREDFKATKDKAQASKDKVPNKENPFRTQLASYFLDVLDLPKAIAITRSPGKPGIKLHKYNNTIRFWLLTMVTLVVSGLVFSSVLIYYNANISSDISIVPWIYVSTWIIALIGAPVSLLVGAVRKGCGNLFPQVLFPKYLSVITLTVITFSFSGKLVVYLSSQMRVPIIIVLCLICILGPAFYLGGKFKIIIKDTKERCQRIRNFLFVSFLEACTLSAVCMFLYGHTFENQDPKFIHQLFQSDLFYFSPIFILLASLVAVLLGIVFKDMLNPVGPDAD